MFYAGYGRIFANVNLFAIIALVSGSLLYCIRNYYFRIKGNKFEFQAIPGSPASDDHNSSESSSIELQLPSVNDQRNSNSSSGGSMGTNDSGNGKFKHDINYKLPGGKLLECLYYILCLVWSTSLTFALILEEYVFEECPVDDNYHKNAIRLTMIGMEVLNELHIPYIMSSGTLLAILRQTPIMPWDNDVDMIILAPTNLKQLHANFSAALNRIKLQDEYNNYPGVRFKIESEMIFRLDFMAPNKGWLDLFPAVLEQQQQQQQQQQLQLRQHTPISKRKRKRKRKLQTQKHKAIESDVIINPPNPPNPLIDDKQQRGVDGRNLDDNRNPINVGDDEEEEEEDTKIQIGNENENNDGNDDDAENGNESMMTYECFHHTMSTYKNMTFEETFGNKRQWVVWKPYNMRVPISYNSHKLALGEFGNSYMKPYYSKRLCYFNIVTNHYISINRKIMYIFSFLFGGVTLYFIAWQNCRPIKRHKKKSKRKKSRVVTKSKDDFYI